MSVFATFIREKRGQLLGFGEYLGQCVMLFWEFNRSCHQGEAYSAPGAYNLYVSTTGQAYLWDTYDRLTAADARATPGTFCVWSGYAGPYQNGGNGHVALLVRNNGDGTGLFFSQNPGPADLVTLRLDGIVGGLFPSGVPAWDGALDDALQERLVTQSVAWVRTAPRADAPLAPEFPEGLAQGAPLAVKGYVGGQDPYQDGNDAWYVTRSGYYVWANAAEDRLDGLVKL